MTFCIFSNFPIIRKPLWHQLALTKQQNHIFLFNKLRKMSLLPPTSMYFQIKSYIPRKSVRNFVKSVEKQSPDTTPVDSSSNERDRILNKCRNILLKLKHAFSQDDIQSWQCYQLTSAKALFAIKHSPSLVSNHLPALTPDWTYKHLVMNGIPFAGTPTSQQKEQTIKA